MKYWALLMGIVWGFIVLVDVALLRSGRDTVLLAAFAMVAYWLAHIIVMLEKSKADLKEIDRKLDDIHANLPADQVIRPVPLSAADLEHMTSEIRRVAATLKR